MLSGNTNIAKIGYNIELLVDFFYLIVNLAVFL